MQISHAKWLRVTFKQCPIDLSHRPVAQDPRSAAYLYLATRISYLCISRRACGYINISLCGYFFVTLYLWLTFISFLMFVTATAPALPLSFHFTVTQISIRFSSFFEFCLAVLSARPIVNIFFHYFPLVFTRLLHSLAVCRLPALPLSTCVYISGYISFSACVLCGEPVFVGFGWPVFVVRCLVFGVGVVVTQVVGVALVWLLLLHIGYYLRSASLRCVYRCRLPAPCAYLAQSGPKCTGENFQRGSVNHKS